MRRLTGRNRTLVLIALLITMVVPRCLMAAEMTGLSGMDGKMAHKPLCHTTASLESIQVGHITCALQCEQSLLSSLTVEKSKNASDSGHAVIVSTLPAFALVTPLSPRQGWPPDNQVFLSNQQSLYLDTGRLRL